MSNDVASLPPPPSGDAPWFVGKMEREKAEQFLKEVRTCPRCHQGCVVCVCVCVCVFVCVCVCVSVIDNGRSSRYMYVIICKTL